MKLSKQKRNQFILVLAGTAAVLVVMWFGLIQPRYAALSQVAAAQKAAGDKLDGIQSAIKHAGTIANDLTNVTRTLSIAETDVASGDLYAWTYNAIRLFKARYQVDIPDIGHPDVGVMNLLPDFPFKQVKFTVTGTACYQDFGKFIAGFENHFPHIRVVDLQLQPARATGSSEKLAFKMDIIALVKPHTSP